jgi:hypothetical protein
MSLNPPDPPILSQGTNQARRGSRKRARPAGGATHRRVRPGHVGPGREGRVMANWPTPTLVAWFGTENCYLAMAAMRPDPSHIKGISGKEKR